MAVLNLVMKGETIAILTCRISCDMSQIQSGGEFFQLPVRDVYANYIYAENQNDLNIIKTWLTSKGYAFGADEDLTPSQDIQNFITDESETKKAGGESKSTVYDKLKVLFPDQVCIDARV